MKKNQKLLLLGLFLMLMFFCFPQTGIVAKPNHLPSKIKVITDDRYPPYIFRDDRGNLQGILVDQWRLWEKQTGIKVEITAMDWNIALDAMKAGEFDVIDTIFQNPERKKYFSFAKPYANIEVTIFFHRNISGITGIRSLRGFKVGVKKGDNAVNQLKEAGIHDYIEFPSYESIVKAAKEHKIMVYVMDKPPALYYLYKMGIQDDFKSAPNPLDTGQFHRAVRKGDFRLLKIVQSGFDSISHRQYREIDAKWLGTSYGIKNVVFQLGIWIWIASLAAGLLFIWNITLRKMVRHKTKELVALIEKVGQREKRLQTLLKAIPDVVFVMDSNGVFLECYTNSESLLMYPGAFHINKSTRELLPENISLKLAADIKHVLATNEILVHEIPFDADPHKLQYLEVRIVPFEAEKVLLVIRDITDKKLAEIKIYEMSVYDSLTGLFNRNYFEKYLNEIHLDETANLALVLCDLDGLKMINDTLGHDAGDQCLKIVAAEMRRNFRENDVVARIGGDEFAVIMKNTTVAEIDAIRKGFKESLNTRKVGDSALPLSVSLGYSLTEERSPHHLKALFKEADDYMYREKLHQQQSAKSNIVNVLLRMLEARDFITEGHGERLQYLAAELAARLGLKEQEINDIKLLAQFHDIGKVGISDAILFKPGRLSKDEYNEMKRHSEIGFRIATSIPDLAHIADWIYKHHEWWNGAGYPLGLQGTAIPLQCRILSIVDAFDAMISDRPYRKALPVEDALNELTKCAGTQFDPEYVACFVELIREDSFKSGTNEG